MLQPSSTIKFKAIFNLFSSICHIFYCPGFISLLISEPEQICPACKRKGEFVLANSKEGMTCVNKKMINELSNKEKHNLETRQSCNKNNNRKKLQFFFLRKAKNDKEIKYCITIDVETEGKSFSIMLIDKEIGDYIVDNHLSEYLSSVPSMKSIKLFMSTDGELVILSENLIHAPEFFKYILEQSRPVNTARIQVKYGNSS